jgi:hypothetical protein
MERRQILGTTSAACAGAGAAALIASANSSVNAVLRPDLGIVGGFLMLAAIAGLTFLFMTAKKTSPAVSGTTINSHGGAGGSAHAPGGIAIGGPGGHSGGLPGRGGDGGGGSGGDINVGGGGGSVDGPDIWFPPAPSGYEVLMRATGQKADPELKKYGRGGMSGGYAEKFTLVEALRADYFRAMGNIPSGVEEDITAMPLNALNTALADAGVSWRARITEYDYYEFYIPKSV